MIQIDKTIVSLNVVEEYFQCSLVECKGACCVHGDSGAPLEDDEIEILKEIFPKIKNFLQNKGVEAIESKGIYTIDKDDEYVTPLIDNKECAFTVFENGIARCGIEKAYFNKVISFRKPISCFLYPIRIKKYEKYDAVNIDKWHICKPAFELGKKKRIFAYKFVEESLIEKYGKEWFKQLCIAAVKINNKNKQT